MAATAHGTLTANQVTTVTIEVGYSGFEVINRTMSGTIWVRYDGEDPAPGEAGSYVVLGARSFPVFRRGSTDIRLISDDARDFSVEAA